MKLYVSEIIVGTLVMIILLLTVILLKSEVRFPFSFINLIEVIAALGTTIAALAAWKSASAANSSARITSEQLKEMQKARKSQIKPAIYIASEDYQIKFNSNRGFGDFNYKIGTPNLLVTNIGQGHAKKINFNWIFYSLDEDVEFIRNYEFGKDKISLYEPGKQFLVWESGSGPLDEDVSNFTPIILKDEHFKLRIPFSYLEVLSLKYFLLLENSLDRNILPEIKLEINFEDTDGKSYIRNFLISPIVFDQGSHISDGKLLDYMSLVNFKIEEPI